MPLFILKTLSKKLSTTFFWLSKLGMKLGMGMIDFQNHLHFYKEISCESTFKHTIRNQGLLFMFYVLRFLWKRKIKSFFSISFSWKNFTFFLFHLRLRSVSHFTFYFTLFYFTLVYAFLCLRFFIVFNIFYVFVHESERKT